VVGDEDLQLEGSEDDTGGSSENELEAYDLEDDESDLSQVKIPVYLRDVLAGESLPLLQFVRIPSSHLLPIETNKPIQGYVPRMSRIAWRVRSRQPKV
jgi:hypothetical protein